jgi:hypothetical protein
VTLIAGSYDTWDYRGGRKAEDTGWLAEVADESIGIVRIARRNGASCCGERSDEN